MSHDLKRRLIGATVLISLAIIFLPMILEHEPLMVDRGEMKPIPKAPDEKFKSSLIHDEVLEEKPQAVADQGSPAVPEVTPEEPAPTPAVEITPAMPVTVDAAPTAKLEAVEPAPKPVEKPAPEPVQVNPGPSAWVIQVGSFSNQENAKKLVARLREAGLNTMDPQPAVVNGKQLYRVKVGPELDKGNAEKLQPKIKQAAGLQGTVIRYP